MFILTQTCYCSICIPYLPVELSLPSVNIVSTQDCMNSTIHSGHIHIHNHTHTPTHTRTYKHKQTCTTHAWHNTPATLPTSRSRERPGLSHWLGPVPCGRWVCVPVHIWRPLGRRTPALTFKPTVWRNMTNCCTFQAWIVPWIYVYHVCVPSGDVFSVWWSLTNQRRVFSVHTRTVLVWGH